MMISTLDYSLRKGSPKAKTHSYSRNESSEIRSEGRQRVHITKSSKEWTQMIKSHDGSVSPQLLTIKRNRYEEINVKSNQVEPDDQLMMSLFKKCFHCNLLHFDSKVFSCTHEGVNRNSCKECYIKHHTLSVCKDHSIKKIPADPMQSNKFHETHSSTMRNYKRNVTAPYANSSVNPTFDAMSNITSTNARNNMDYYRKKTREDNKHSVNNIHSINNTINNEDEDEYLSLFNRNSNSKPKKTIGNILNVPLTTSLNVPLTTNTSTTFNDPFNSTNTSTITYMCEYYYINKSRSKGIYKKKCPYCKEKLFHVNELLYFSTVNDLIEYLLYLFTFQLDLISYNREITNMNQLAVTKYSKVKALCWFIEPKTLCKGCLLLIINQVNCIGVLKNILIDKGMKTEVMVNDKKGNQQQKSIQFNYPVNKANSIRYPSTESKQPNLSQKRAERTRKRNMRAKQSFDFPEQTIDGRSLNNSKPKQRSISPVIIDMPIKEAKNPISSSYSSSIPMVKPVYVPKELFDIIEELNIDLTASIDKLTKGAMQFNDHYQVSPIEKKSYEQYCKKIQHIYQSNKDTIVNLIQTTLTYKKNLFSFLDFVYHLYSLFTNKTKAISKVIKGIIETIENDFSEFNTLISNYSQALITVQNLTTDYLANLEIQGRIFNYVSIQN